MKRILSLIFVLSMCLCLFSCGGDEEVPKGMKAANNKVVDYVLYVPESWVVSINDKGVTQAYVSKNDRTNVLVEQWNLTQNTKTIKDWWEKEYKPGVFTADVVKDFQIDKNEDGSEGVAMLLNGKEAFKYSYTGKMGDAYFKYQVIACITNGSIYTIQICYLQDNEVKEGEKPTFSSVDTHKNAIDQIIANFKFK